MREFQILACVRDDSTVVRKFIVTKIEAAGLHPDVAADNWFTMAPDDQEHWVREITPAVVQLETRGESYATTKLFPAKLKIGDGAIEPSPDFPADTTYKGAWSLAGDAIVHDMPKARALHRTMLRARRAPLLAKLDIHYSRADEAGNAGLKATVAGHKQALRDAPSDAAIEAAADVETLKAVVPAAITEAEAFLAF